MHTFKYFVQRITLTRRSGDEQFRRPPLGYETKLVKEYFMLINRPLGSHRIGISAA